MASSSLRLPPPLWGRSARTRSARAGRGVCGPQNQTSTPLPIPPPQGGREEIAARAEPYAIASPTRAEGAGWGSVSAKSPSLSRLLDRAAAGDRLEIDDIVRLFAAR